MKVLNVSSWPRIVQFFLVLVCMSLTTYADEKLSKKDAHQALENFVETQLIEDDIHALSLAIVHEQQTWFSKGFGLADADREVDADINTQFRLGAVSSIFTALIILKLEEQNKLSLDDKISRFLPELTFKTRDGRQHAMTIRQLLTHHSGLPLSILKNSWAEQPPRFTSVFQENQPLILSQVPDTIYTYSNLGYSLLGYVIELVTEKSYQTNLHELLLTPLQMTNTGISLPGRSAENLALTYKKQLLKDRLFPRDLPALGIYSSARDMAKLLQYLNRIMDKKSKSLSYKQLEKMLRIQNIHVPLDLGKKTGLAWTVGGMAIKNAGPVVWRGGASMYHRSRIVYLPDKKIGVVVMANDSSAWESVEKVSKQAVEITLESIYGITQENLEKLNEPAVAYGSDDEFAEYYSSFLGFIPVHEEEGRLKATLLGWNLNLNPVDGGWFALEYDLLGFIPINISWIADIKIKPARIKQHRVVIVLYKGAQHLFASHFASKTVTREWRKRVGEYQLANPDSLSKAMEVKEGELLIEDNRLFFRYELPMMFGVELKVPLKIIDDDLAVIPGLGTALNESIRVKRKHNKELLVYSGYEVEKVVKKSFF